MLSQVSAGLVKLDYACDWVPGLSTISNLTNLFIKTVIIPCLSDETIIANRYLSYIDSKAKMTCFLSAIPFFNLCVVQGCQEFSPLHYEDPTVERKWVINSINEQGLSVHQRYAEPQLFFGIFRTEGYYIDITPREEDMGKYGIFCTTLPMSYMRDKEIMLAVVKQYPWLLSEASPGVQNNMEVAQAAVQKSYPAFEYVGDDIQNDPTLQEIVRNAGGNPEEMIERRRERIKRWGS